MYAHHWQTVLSPMQHLTHVELHQMLICDPMLLAIGNSPHGLKQLLMDTGVYRACGAVSSAAGAQAIAHVAHIELVFGWKGFLCSQNRELVQPPGIRLLKRTDGRHTSKWSPDTYTCRARHQPP